MGTSSSGHVTQALDCCPHRSTRISRTTAALTSKRSTSGNAMTGDELQLSAGTATALNAPSPGVAQFGIFTCPFVKVISTFGVGESAIAGTFESEIWGAAPGVPPRGTV